MIELIPAIDLLEGKVVRLKKGDFEQSRAYGEPGEVAKNWLDQGTTILHVVDLDGAREGRLVNLKALQAILATGLQVQFGGGIRSWETLEHLFELGVRRAILGTAAVKSPEFVQRALAVYKEHIVLGLDSRAGMVSLEGWAEQSELSEQDLLSQLALYGLTNFIYTDIERDGMLTGPNLAGASRLCAQYPTMNCVLSGGVGSLDDLVAIRTHFANTENLYGVIAGTALYENRFTFQEGLAALN